MLRSAEAKLLFNRFVHLYDGLFLFFCIHCSSGGVDQLEGAGGLGRFEKGWLERGFGLGLRLGLGYGLRFSRQPFFSLLPVFIFLFSLV